MIILLASHEVIMLKIVEYYNFLNQTDSCSRSRAVMCAKQVVISEKLYKIEMWLLHITKVTVCVRY